MATVEGNENTSKSAMIREEQGILEDTLKILDDKKKDNDRWLEHFIDDMVDADDQISADKWNLFAVDDVKGLEFSSVIAILGGMTDNEQYIACTRALDKLVVYERTI